jgi:hypothetical protein
MFSEELKVLVKATNELAQQVALIKGVLFGIASEISYLKREASERAERRAKKERKRRRRP